jgi:hypothetical protein
MVALPPLPIEQCDIDEFQFQECADFGLVRFLQHTHDVGQLKIFVTGNGSIQKKSLPLIFFTTDINNEHTTTTNNNNQKPTTDHRPPTEKPKPKPDRRPTH